MNECIVYKPCKNGGTCVNTVGDYNCQCPDNYKGKNCDEGCLEYRLLLLLFSIYISRRGRIWITQQGFSPGGSSLIYKPLTLQIAFLAEKVTLSYTPSIENETTLKFLP